MGRVAILQGHPDPAGGHLCHALADAYAEGAAGAGHQVARVEIARLDLPFLRSKSDFEDQPLPAMLAPARDAIVSATHLLLVFPLWLGTMPALVKAFLEQTMRPGIAFAYRAGGMPEKLLAGRSAHLVVTMGMPAFAYSMFYRAHGVRGLERNILNFVGIKPVRRTLFGMVEEAREETRRSWVARMREAGRKLR
jgi:putative NADPH-quinone reductase